MRIVAVCGSFHKEEVEKMLEYARDEAGTMNSQLTDIVWVPGVYGSTSGFGKTTHP